MSYNLLEVLPAAGGAERVEQLKAKLDDAERVLARAREATAQDTNNETLADDAGNAVDEVIRLEKLISEAEAELVASPAGDNARWSNPFGRVVAAAAGWRKRRQEKVNARRLSPEQRALLDEVLWGGGKSKRKQRKQKKRKSKRRRSRAGRSFRKRRRSRAGRSSRKRRKSRKSKTRKSQY